MSELFIKPEYMNILKEIFSNYCPEAEIWAYGSRLNGRAHAGSDLDLTIKSFNSEGKKLYELKELLSESNIPFLVDINIFDTLPDSFKEEIMKNYVRIF